MFSRVAMMSAVAVLTVFLNSTGSAQQPPAPTFTITSVSYYTNSQPAMQTATVTGGSVQIPADAASSDMFINGTYTPNSNPIPAFAGRIGVSLPNAKTYTNSGVPTLTAAANGNTGNWSYKIPLNTLNTNTSYSVQTYVVGGDTNTVSINNTVVNTTPIKLTISANS